MAESHRTQARFKLPSEAVVRYVSAGALQLVQRAVGKRVGSARRSSISDKLILALHLWMGKRLLLRFAMALRSELDMSTHAINSASIRILDNLRDGPLAAANGKSYQIKLAELKPVRPRTGWLYVAVAVREGSAPAISRTPLAMGLISGGGRLVKPWMELRIYPTLELADGATLDARAIGLEAAFINLIGEVIPPGGHLMVEYESPGQAETHAELLLRVPPAGSYLGAMMFHAGFRGAFKDWYISEGGHEGPRKLQANKSPTPAAARAALTAHRAELSAFLHRELPEKPEHAAIIRTAQQRAAVLLKKYADDAT
jgi:hypothetical protein